MGFHCLVFLDALFFAWICQVLPGYINFYLDALIFLPGYINFYMNTLVFTWMYQPSKHPKHQQCLQFPNNCRERKKDQENRSSEAVKQCTRF